jgi:hypothetical protein
MLTSSPRRGLLCVLGMLTQLAGAAPVVGRHHHHSVRIGALREDNNSSTVAASAGGGCDGAPTFQIPFIADGQCHSNDAMICRITKSPECSYIMSVDATTAHPQVFAVAGCQGTPTGADDAPLNSCFPEPEGPSWIKLVQAAGSNVVTEQYFSPPAPAPAGSCDGGDPAGSSSWTVNNQCVKQDTSWCQSNAHVPDCSYRGTALDASAVHFAGWWLNADCQGDPALDPASYPVNTCLEGDDEFYKWVPTGVDTVSRTAWHKNPPPPPSPVNCGGDPILSIAYTADGQCNTFDAGTCQIVAKSPECSYMATVDISGTKAHFGGVWVGAGCQGTPVSPPADLALNTCTQANPTDPTIWLRFVATAGSNVVTELVFQAGGGAPPPPSPPYTGRVPTAAEVAAAVQPALDAVSQRFNASFSFGW